MNDGQTAIPSGVSPRVRLGCRRDCDDVLGALDEFKVGIDAMMTLLERCKEAGDGGPVGRGEAFGASSKRQ